MEFAWDLIIDVAVGLLAVLAFAAVLGVVIAMLYFAWKFTMVLAGIMLLGCFGQTVREVFR